MQRSERLGGRVAELDLMRGEAVQAISVAAVAARAEIALLPDLLLYGTSFSTCRLDLVFSLSPGATLGAGWRSTLALSCRVLSRVASECTLLGVGGSA